MTYRTEEEQLRARVDEHSRTIDALKAEHVVLMGEVEAAQSALAEFARLRQEARSGLFTNLALAWAAWICAGGAWMFLAHDGAYTSVQAIGWLCIGLCASFVGIFFHRLG